MKILIVDDEPLIVDALELFLGKQGHDVIAVCDVSDAIAEIGNQEGRIDILIADICMPKSDGIALMGEVKKRYPDIHVILMTGNLRNFSASYALERGACAYLRKPVKFSELSLLLREISRYRRKCGIIESLSNEVQNERKKLNETIKGCQFSRKMHGRLLPKDFSWLNRTKIHIRYLPMAAVGGDFIEVRPYGRSKALFMLADFSGHGVPSAFGAITLKTWMSSLKHGLTPNAILSEAESILCEIFPEEFCASAFCGIYDEKEHELFYSIAGHPPPFILNPTESGRFLKDEGAALGVKKGNGERKNFKEKLADNDMLIAFTDGLTRKPGKLMQRIYEIIKEKKEDFPWRNLSGVVTLLLDACNEIAPAHAFTDDLTALALAPKYPEELALLPSIASKKIIFYSRYSEVLREFASALATEKCEIMLKETSTPTPGEINECAPDIIVCDIDERKKNGVNIISKIRLGFPDIPLLVISSGLSEKTIKVCIKEKVSGFLDRPFQKDELVLSIQSALALEPGREHISFDDVRPDWMDFVISSSPVALELLNRYLESLQKQPIPPEALKDVLYCIREIAGNAIEWGNLRNMDFKVRISSVTLSDRIMIKISDEGAGFDVKRILQKKDAFEAAEEREIQGKRDGGFGLVIVSELMDNISFNEKGNVVMMTKMF